MNKRSIAYMQSHDIDWYFKANGKHYHCASNGGILPVECRDILTLNRLNRAVSQLPPIYSPEDIEFNDAYINRIVRQQVEIWHTMFADSEELKMVINGESMRNQFLSSFLNMAIRGFISIDRFCGDMNGVNIKNKEYQEQYVYIARPRELPKGLQVIYDRPYNTHFPDLTDKLAEDGDTVTIFIN